MEDGSVVVVVGGVDGCRWWGLCRRIHLIVRLGLFVVAPLRILVILHPLLLVLPDYPEFLGLT